MCPWEIRPQLSIRKVSMGQRSSRSTKHYSSWPYDSEAAATYRANYATTNAYKAGSQAPGLVGCDIATSDVYYSGALLSEAFDNTTKLFTNGTGNYCTTAQEDNATLEALLRAAVFNLTDFSRIIVMRTASDFDRPFNGEPDTVNLFYADQGGFEPAIQNILPCRY